MGALEDLEAATAAAAQTVKQKRKEEEKLAKMSETEKLIRAENMAPPGLDFTEVTQYYAHVRKEPREILEARFVKDQCLGNESLLPLKARHDYLSTSCAYYFQVKWYEAHVGKCPANVVRRYNGILWGWPHGLFGQEYDAQDPTWSTDPEIWDDTYVVAAKPNPWQKNVAQKAFFCVEMAGETGIQFAPLCETIERMCELSVDHAQLRAYDMFTKYVREGLTRIRIA